MPEIFINYRTGDEESAAAMIDRELSRRFGSDRIFFASKSIAPGRRFPDELLSAAGECSALLAVIGPDWADARTSDGSLALENAEDWTRREILAALESGALVVPVLVGKATRLEREKLPTELRELADHQYRRLDHRNAGSDLSALGDMLANLIPQLGAVDADRGKEAGQPGEERNTVLQARDVRQHLRSGIGNLNGDLSGTFLNEPQGPVHTGGGSQYNAPRIEGDGNGVIHVAGDNSGTAEQRFGAERRSADPGQ
jgi:hypothetical protein